MIFSRLHNLINQGRNLMQFTLMKVFGEIIFLGIPLILAKFITPEQFGSYSLSMMIIYLLTTIMMSSIKTPFIKYANEDLKATGKINKSFSAFIFLWSISILLFFIIFVFFRFPIKAFTELSGNEFLLLGLALLGISLRIFFDTIFLSLNRRLENARFWFAMGIVSILYIIISYATVGINPSSVFLMFLIVPLSVFLFFFKRDDLSKLFPLTLDRKYLAKIWVFGAWVAIGGAAVYLLNWGDNLVLRATLEMKDVGVYNLAYQIFKGAIVLTGFANSYFLPFLSQNLGNPLKIKFYVYKKRPILLAIGFIFIIILAILVPYIIKLFYGTAYAEASFVIYFLFIGLLFSWYKQLYEPLFNALERYKFVQITNIILVFFNLGLDYWLVIRWQNIISAAVATMVTYIILAIIYEVYYQKTIKGKVIRGESLLALKD